MKKLLFFLAALIMSTGLWAGNPNATQIDGIFYILDETTLTASVTWGGGNETESTPEYSGAITIPDFVNDGSKEYAVTSIGFQAFNACVDLTSVTMPNSVTSIEDFAFAFCIGLTSITIPNSVTSIGDYAFSGCTALMSVTLSKNLTSIGEMLFWACENLGSIIIPNGVKSIGMMAFIGCNRLSSITIPSSVTNIDNMAFNGCVALTDVTVNWTEAENICKIDASIFYDVDLNGVTLHVPYGTTAIYKAAYLWQDFGKIEEMPMPDYLCFTAEEANSSVTLSKKNSPTEVILQTSTDGTSWSNYTFGNAITFTNVGDKVYFRNAKPATEVSGFSTGTTAYYKFGMEGKIAASGNVMSLVDKNCLATKIPNEYSFCHLFNGCKSLTTAPKLPATTLKNSCYYYMFQNCTSLTTAPELPATTVAENSYRFMFFGCTSLSAAPELPATTLASGCYYYMFSGCTSLTTAPKLLATTLANDCYYYMFNGCTSLKTAPELPATELAEKCCQYMFNGCTSLTTAPELPATTLASDCYYYMFNGCTSLATAPELPATTLASGCYRAMFCGCKNLSAAPELPATTVAENCYRDMFQSCTSLTTAPELPATKLAKYCYFQMFKGCTSLNDIKVAFTAWDGATDQTYNWVSSVPSTGKFTCPSGLSKDLPGSGTNPSGWTVSNTFDLKISSVGWTSFCANLPLQVPSTKGVEVYYASAVDGSTITLNKIPAGTTMAPLTAVLVKATANSTVQFPVMGFAGTAYDDNLFKGTSVEKARTEDVYTLTGASPAGPLFQNYVGETLGAHKAYLPKSAVPSSAKELTFVFDDTTGINNVSLGTNANAAMYNLNGVRVSEGYKGIVIKNGKRFINK
ncbi:MAG: leucine-rich repeat protein [Prevotellaceae bacterium]|nr:leucine-rich repeat protein [Prevotellaceae bacterium]